MWLPGFSLRKYSAKIRTYVNYLSFTDEIENNITTKKEDGIANVELLPWSYTCVYPPPTPRHTVCPCSQKINYIFRNRLHVQKGKQLNGQQ